MLSRSYYNRFVVGPPTIERPPAPDLGLVVVIPCFNESELIKSLGSLWRCTRPRCSVEVIIVVNSSELATASQLSANTRTIEQTLSWIAEHDGERMRFHVLHRSNLPAKHAGVGLARKIGMDEAARRLDAVNHPESVIACFDADCLCDENYLCALEWHFEVNAGSPGCSIYYEHPLAGELPQPVYEGITLYELHLRYYIQALRFAGFPFAFHTIGSSMAVRNQVYQRQGGMNKRRAGEDFYFLHKIIPLGGFTDLTATRVIPSPRVSDRVPFGTGRAIQSFLSDGKLQTYPLTAFCDLRQFFAQINRLHGGEALDQLRLADSVRTFLAATEFEEAVAEIRENTSNEPAFRKRFFQWCNGFRVMKFIHHARDHFYGGADVPTSALGLLAELGIQIENPTVQDLLTLFRERDRGGVPGLRL